MGSEGRQVYGTLDPVIETGQDPPNTGLRRRTRMGNYPISGKDHLPISGRDVYEKTKR